MANLQRCFIAMLRGYRGILIAIAGLIATPLQAQQPSDARSSQSSALQDRRDSSRSPAPIAPAINPGAAELAESRKDQSDPYGDERNQRERRDLIAQENSAYWARSNFWAMVVQTLVAAIALMFLLLDLRQNRKSAEAQLRAYVSFKDVKLNILKPETEVGGVRPSLDFKMVNGGQTPAYKCTHAGNIAAMTDAEATEYFEVADQVERIGRESPFTIHIGGEFDGRAYAHRDFTNKEVLSLRDGTKKLYVFVACDYYDTFGVQRRSRFCFTMAGPLITRQTDPNTATLVDINWEMAPFHNDAD